MCYKPIPVPHPAASRCSSVTHDIGSVTDIPQRSNGFDNEFEFE